jgi:hypothetical protein
MQWQATHASQAGWPVCVDARNRKALVWQLLALKADLGVAFRHAECHQAIGRDSVSRFGQRRRAVGDAGLAPVLTGAYASNGVWLEDFML